MLDISHFSFKSKDGTHIYIYNPNARISSFCLIKDDEIVYRHDLFCQKEEYHIRRIQHDFNDNFIDLPNEFLFDFRYYWKYDKKLFSLWLVAQFIYSPFSFIFNLSTKIHEVLNADKDYSKYPEYSTFRD